MNLKLNKMKECPNCYKELEIPFDATYLYCEICNKSYEVELEEFEVGYFGYIFTGVEFDGKINI